MKISQKRRHLVGKAPTPPSCGYKLDYCNSLYHNLPKSQITRLQQIQNSLARAIVKAPKSSHITPILRSLHWLKITERIEYKLLSLTYKVFTTTRPSYLHNLITVQPPRSTRSSSLVRGKSGPALGGTEYRLMPSACRLIVRAKL